MASFYPNICVLGGGPLLLPFCELRPQNWESGMDGEWMRRIQNVFVRPICVDPVTQKDLPPMRTRKARDFGRPKFALNFALKKKRFNFSQLIHALRIISDLGGKQKFYRR